MSSTIADVEPSATNDFGTEFANLPVWNIFLIWLILFFSFRFFIPSPWKRVYGYTILAFAAAHFSYAKILFPFLSWLSPGTFLVRIRSIFLYRPTSSLGSFLWSVLLPLRFVLVWAYRILRWLSGNLLWAFQKLAWFGFFVNFFWVGVNFIWYGINRIAQFLEEVADHAKKRDEEEELEKEAEERRKRYEREAKQRMRDDETRSWQEEENRKASGSKNGKKKKGKH